MSADKCRVCGKTYRECTGGLFKFCHSAERLAIERAKEIERLKDVQANMEMEIENLKFKLAEIERLKKEQTK